MYTETTGRGQSENNPGAILVSQPVEQSPQPVKVTTPKIETASSIPKPAEQSKHQPINLMMILFLKILSNRWLKGD